MKAKKLIAVALAAGMLIGGGSKALDLTIPTAYASTQEPAAEFTITVTTTKPDGTKTQSTVTGKDVEEAKKNVAEKAEKIDGYKIKIDFSADNKTANVTYEKEEKQVKTWDVNVSLQIYSLTGQLWQDVPGATITLTNSDTGATVHTYTTTTADGGYAHANVPEGNYTLTVTSLPTGGVLAGKTYVWDGPSSVSLNIQGPTSQPFHLKELSTVTYRFKDTEGNVIAPEETTQLDRTGVYQLKKNGLPQPKAIENYKFVKFEHDGDIDKGSGSFTYIYEALIYTRFVDPSGNDIAPKEYGIKELKIIKGYKWIRTEKDEKGNVTHIYLPEFPDDNTATTTTTTTNENTDKEPDKNPEDEKENSDENKAKDLIDKLNKNTKEIERILKENEANQDKEPDKNPDEKPDKKPDKKPEKKPEKDNKGKKSNPKTGVAGISLVAGSLAVASAALVATKKKNK